MYIENNFFICFLLNTIYIEKNCGTIPHVITSHCDPIKLTYFRRYLEKGNRKIPPKTDLSRKTPPKIEQKIPSPPENSPWA